MKNFIASLALITSLALIGTSPISAVPGSVIIIPHAETDASGNLSQKGLERAGALAAYFAFTPALTQNGPPVAIFAARPSTLPGESTQSCIRTIALTALMLKLPIHSGYASNQTSELATFILNHPEYDGKTVLISWQPTAITALAAALGVESPPVFDPTDADVTWLVTYPVPYLNVYLQELLFGDQ